MAYTITIFYIRIYFDVEYFYFLILLYSCQYNAQNNKWS